MSATETECIRLVGGPMDGAPAIVAPDQLGVPVRGPLERGGKRSLNTVLVGVYMPDGTVWRGYERWTWRPMWEQAA